MPNGLPNPKTILQQQVASVRSIEGVLPKGFPSMTNVLTSVANTLPELPDLPTQAGVLPQGLQLPMAAPTAITSFVKSVESALPTGLPSVSGVLGSPGGYRAAPPVKGAKAVTSGGYRPIT